MSFKKQQLKLFQEIAIPKNLHEIPPIFWPKRYRTILCQSLTSYTTAGFALRVPNPDTFGLRVTKPDVFSNVGGKITSASITTQFDDVGAFERRLEDAPNLRVYVADCVPPPLIPDIDFPAPAEPDPELEPMIGLFHASEEYLKEGLFYGLKPKEEREILTAAGYTNQIRDDIGPFHSTILWHQSRDEATFLAALEKRISITSRGFNLRAFHNPRARALGRALFDAFMAISDLPSDPVPFDSDMYSDCINVWMTNRVRKGMKQLANIDGRGDPDIPINHVDLFLKSQKIMKDEKFRSDAKAGQTIISMHVSLLRHTGPMARYISRQVARFTPEHQMIFTETSPDELETWTKKFMDFSKPTLASDFTAFDQSQNEEFLWFEIFLLQHFNYPAEEIHLYVSTKLNTRLYLGILSIMRLTGEGPTFTFNTFGGKAFIALKYGLDRRAVIGSSGDDTILNGDYTVSPVFREKYEKFFKIVSKEDYEDPPVLCGWKLTPEGIFKSIQKLFVSFLVQEEAGNLRQAASSYAIEHHYFYEKAARLEKYMTPIDFERAQWLNRQFVLMHHPLYSRTGQRSNYLIYRDFGSDYWQMAPLGSKLVATY